MNDIPLSLLFGALALLLLLSAFFSGSETALMSINRYRLMHLASEGHRGARLAARLLQHPDRLIGLILLGNNFVNILASAITTVAFVRLAGEAGILVGTVFLTLTVLIFSEVAPKTLAAFNPERIALPASYVLWPMLRACYPLVRVINWLAGGVLRLFGHRGGRAHQSDLSQEELRTLLEHGGSLIPEGHRKMFLNILALEDARVEDIMVPRTEIRGIDLDNDPETLLAELELYPYSRAIVYRGHIDQVVGVLNMRELLRLRNGEAPTPAWVESRLRKPYFIPEGTRLPQQLVEFQRQQRRLGLVVNEYGEIVGLITLADILEEIVGEFTTEPKQNTRRIERLDDGSLLVDGRIAVHSLNRRTGLELSTEDANTLSGLIVNRAGAVPQPGAELWIDDLRVHVEQVRGSVVRMARIWPPEAEDRQAVGPE